MDHFLVPNYPKVADTRDISFVDHHPDDGSWGFPWSFWVSHHSRSDKLISPLIVASLTIIFLIRVWFFKNRSTLKKIKRPHSYRDLSSFSHENDLTCLLWSNSWYPPCLVYISHTCPIKYTLSCQSDRYISIVSQLLPNNNPSIPNYIPIVVTYFQLLSKSYPIDNNQYDPNYISRLSNCITVFKHILYPMIYQ